MACSLTIANARFLFFFCLFNYPPIAKLKFVLLIKLQSSSFKSPLNRAYKQNLQATLRRPIRLFVIGIQTNDSFIEFRNVMKHLYHRKRWSRHKISTFCFREHWEGYCQSLSNMAADRSFERLLVDFKVESIVWLFSHPQ